MITNIQNIPIDDIHPHPDNPRKDLGDLAELDGGVAHRSDGS